MHSDGLGLGSEFLIRLPTSAKELLEEARVAPASQPAPAANGKRVLLVDDNVDAAELLSEILRRGGHDVAVAHDPLEALDLVPRFRPEIAVLDIGLPVMDGYALALKIRQIPNAEAMRMIALTGYGQQQDRSRSEAAGFEHHLVKPVNVKQLLSLFDHAQPPR